MVDLMSKEQSPISQINPPKPDAGFSGVGSSNKGGTNQQPTNQSGSKNGK